MNRNQSSFGQRTYEDMRTLLGIVLLVMCEAIQEASYIETSTVNEYERRVLSENDGCKTMKKLILDVGPSGLGNRMLALVSALQLAIKMNRILELVWDKNRGCDAGGDNLDSATLQ